MVQCIVFDSLTTSTLSSLAPKGNVFRTLAASFREARYQAKWTEVREGSTLRANRTSPVI